MNINAINNIKFTGLYRIDKKYVGNNTRDFFRNRPVIITPNEENDNDLFVLTEDNTDAEFEDSIKLDSGKYWKSRPLSDLMKYPLLLEAIYHGNIVKNNYKENWVDYTDKWQPTQSEDDEITF